MLRSKPKAPRGRPIISIGYKYNACKVVYFIVTENAGSAQADIPCLSKYLDQFSNVSIHPVACTLVMYKLFGQLTRLNTTTNQGSLIWCWRSYGLLSVVGYGYVLQLL